MKSKIWLSLKLKSATVLKVEAVYLFVAVYLEIVYFLIAEQQHVFAQGVRLNEER